MTGDQGGDEREMCITHPERPAIAFSASCRECHDGERKHDRAWLRLVDAAEAIYKRHGEHCPPGSWRSPGHDVIRAEWDALGRAIEENTP